MSQRSLCLAVCLVLAGCSMFGRSTDVTAKDGRSATAEVKDIIQRAQAGDPAAQFALGVAYENGTGVRLDEAEAEEWYRKAAEAGHVGAQNSLGTLLQSERRFPDAMPWYERAAAQGHAGANNTLGKIYDQGLGVMRDSNKSLEYFLLAADLGVPEAMWSISTIYNEGRLGKKDPLQACVWGLRTRRFAAANRVLFTQIGPAIALLERSLSGRELSECRKQAETWEPNRLPK